ncbi:hypothetical protein OIDMADRAFT_181575 [Oidiodendron maius Zn]|uniref:Major facilitator superfamily (MFS) profile domain-containing protein n=1 Tax=Oidiodendron maius (strain Zn) TaxID=913774 RepID=A0A0C3CJQ2_OIDMZ|nr:hypothetical protein OIDMADRAFT_181575 [Oidiodendron maius Zn]
MSKEGFTHEETASAQYVTPFVENPELERRILWKVDLRLIPPLFIMYILNYLDRNNIGNAKVAGMQTDLHLTSSDYSLALSIFFIGYLLLEVPSNMILSRTRPSLYLPSLMFVWGCLVTAYTGVNTKSGLVGLRFVLGLVEAGYFPGVLLFMSNWYKKSELARRFSIFYCASLVSGAVGGLIAGLIVDNMQHRGGLPAWKWLFLIEGVITIGCAVIAVFILPDFPATTKWLTDEEREYAIRRLEQDNMSSEARGITHLQSFLYAIKDWRTWLFMLAQSLCTCAGTITYFIPTLMAALGYKGNMVQYMTIPIYCVALVIVLICCFSSDLQNERPKHIMVMASISTISLIIVAAVDNPKVRYAFLSFGAAGIWCCSPMTLSYLSNTISRPMEKRAVSIGIVNALANLSSVYGSYIWPSSSAPKYIPGFSVSIALMAGCVGTAFALLVLTKKYPYELTRDGGFEDETQSSELGRTGEA